MTIKRIAREMQTKRIAPPKVGAGTKVLQRCPTPITTPVKSRKIKKAY